MDFWESIIHTFVSRYGVKPWETVAICILSLATRSQISPWLLFPSMPWNKCRRFKLKCVKNNFDTLKCAATRFCMVQRLFCNLKGRDLHFLITNFLDKMAISYHKSIT